jgi:hypothetical protein
MWRRADAEDNKARFMNKSLRSEIWSTFTGRDHGTLNIQKEFGVVVLELVEH